MTCPNERELAAEAEAHTGDGVGHLRDAPAAEEQLPGGLPLGDAQSLHDFIIANVSNRPAIERLARRLEVVQIERISATQRANRERAAREAAEALVTELRGEVQSFERTLDDIRHGDDL